MAKKESVGDFTDFFSFFQNEISPVVSVKDAICNSVGTYLQKGERLLSLAKEKYSDVIKGLEITSFEESLYDLDLKKDCLEEAVIKLVRTVLRKAENVETDNMVKEMLSLISYDIKLTQPSTRFERNTRMAKRFRSEPYLLLEAQLGPPYWQSLFIYGLKNSKHVKTQSNLLYRDGYNEADIATILASLLILSLAQKDEDAFVPLLGYDIKGARCTLGYSKNNVSRYSTNYNFVDVQLKEPFSSKWLIPLTCKSDFNQYHQSFFDALHIEYEEVTGRYEDIENFVRDDIVAGKYNDEPRSMPVVYSYERFAQVLRCFPVGMAKNNGGVIPLWLFLEESYRAKCYFWAIPHRGPWYELYRHFLKNYKVYSNKVSTLKQLKGFEKSGDYAKSYQTKMHIPQKTIAAMEKSLFNDYFGYVEFDEDVDLEKVEEIAKEFVAFKETYFKDIDISDNQIRFRRLGNHKALGLYYPTIKCLCVDIFSPSSLTHEFGHLLDYCLGNLSAKPEFLEVSSLYEKLIRQKMTEDKAFAEQMQGKGKYNLSYFLTPTEIFARSFELYCTDVLNVQNSLNKQVYGNEYPRTTEFIGLITDYFATIFNKEMSEECSEDVSLEKVADF